MTGDVLLRDFTCAVCGAPRRTTDGALVVLCRHCGAILTFSGDGLWHEAAFAGRHAAGIRQIVRPSAAQARLLALSMEMATTTTDRARWRVLAEEQVVVMAIAHPEHVPPLPSDPAARARHVAEAVTLSEIATFDPTVAGRMHAYGAATGALTRGDPVTAARAMLDAARAYYRAIAAHPELPPGALREGPEHLARELVRSGVQGHASLLGANTVERIRTEVLGDAREPDDPTARPSCPKCGAPLEGAGLARCRHCGAVTGVAEEDAWTTAQLALWAITRQDLVRRGQLDGPTPVVTAAGGFLHTGARAVPPGVAFAFLRRAIPWVTRDDLLGGLDLLGHASSGEARPLLDALRALASSDWTPDPSTRPAPHVARTDFEPPTPEEEAAWIESALGLWRFRFGPSRGDTGAPGSLLELLGHPLSALQVAAVQEQPSAVTPRSALAFFERAWPGFDRAALRAEVARLAPGYDHPRLRAFTSGLVASLGDPPARPPRSGS